MRKITYFCDRCGAQIFDNVYQSGYKVMDVQTGDVAEEEFNAEFCKDCFGDVDDAVAVAVMAGRKEPKVAAGPKVDAGTIKIGSLDAQILLCDQEPEKAPAQKPEREPDEKVLGKKARDMGKVHALLDAGWTKEKIGVEFGVSGTTITNWLRGEDET